MAKTPKPPKGPKTPPKTEVDKNTDDYGSMFKQLDEPTGTSSPGPADASEKIKKQKITDVKLPDASKSKREDQKPLPTDSDIQRIGDSIKKIDSSNDEVKRIKDAVKSDISNISKQLKKQNDAIVQLRTARVDDFKAVQKAIGEVNKQIARLQRGYNDLSGQISGMQREVAKIRSRPVGLPMGSYGSGHSEKEDEGPTRLWDKLKNKAWENYQKGDLYRAYRKTGMQRAARATNNWLKGGGAAATAPKLPAAPAPRVPFSNPGAVPQISGMPPEPIAPGSPAASGGGSFLGNVARGAGSMLLRGASAIGMTRLAVAGGAVLAGAGLYALRQGVQNRNGQAGIEDGDDQETISQKLKADSKRRKQRFNDNLRGSRQVQDYSEASRRNRTSGMNPTSWDILYHRAQIEEQNAQFMKFGQLPPGFEFLPGHMGRLGSPGAVSARGAMPISGGMSSARRPGGNYSPGYTPDQSEQPTTPQQPTTTQTPGRPNTSISPFGFGTTMGRLMAPAPAVPPASGPQPAVTSAPISGGAAYLANQRADFKRQIEADPSLKKLLGAVISSENIGAGPAVVESLFNRTNYMNEMRSKQGKAPLTLKQMIIGQPGRSFYGPINRGSINDHLRKMNDPKFAARMHALIEQAYTSNVIKGHTDQGSAGDPNYIAGGKGVNINGERFNDWGLPGTRQWREKNQREYQAAEERAAAERAQAEKNKENGVIEAPAAPGAKGKNLTPEEEARERAADKAAIEKSLQDKPPGMMKLGGPKPGELSDNRIPNPKPGGSGEDALKNKSEYAGSVIHMSPLSLEKLKEGETRPGSPARAYGYHTAITPDGQVHELRPYDARPNQIESVAGGHRPGAQYLENRNAYGVVLTGDGQLNEKNSAALKEHFASLVARGILPRDYSGYGEGAKPVYGHGEIQHDAPNPFQRQTLDKGAPEGAAGSKFLNDNWKDILARADAIKSATPNASPIQSPPTKPNDDPYGTGGGDKGSGWGTGPAQLAIPDHIKDLSQRPPAVIADGRPPIESAVPPQVVGGPVNLDNANKSRADIIGGTLKIPAAGNFGAQSYPARTGGWGKGSMPYGYHKLSPQFGASRIENYLSNTPLSRADKAQVFNVGKEGAPIQLDDPKYGGKNARAEIQIHGGALTSAKLDKLYSEGCLAIPYDKWGGPNGAKAHILQYIKENPTATLAFLPSPKGQPHEFRILTREQAEAEKRVGNVKVLTPEEAANNFKKSGNVGPPPAPYKDDGNDPAFNSVPQTPLSRFGQRMEATSPKPDGTLANDWNASQNKANEKDSLWGKNGSGAEFGTDSTSYKQKDLDQVRNELEQKNGGASPAVVPAPAQPEPPPMAPDTDQGYAPEKGFVDPNQNDPGASPDQGTAAPAPSSSTPTGTEGDAETPNFRNNPESAPESPGSGGQGSYGRCFV